MKIYYLVFMCLLIGITSVHGQPRYSRELVVKVKSVETLAKPSSSLQKFLSKISSVSISNAKRIFEKTSASNLQSVRSSSSDLARIIIIPIYDGIDIQQIFETLTQFAEIEFAEPNYIYHVDAAPKPNDSLYSEQWAHRVMHVPEAWQITQGDTAIQIGFIDTGVEWDHPDLLGQFAVNPSEDINRNGLFDAWPSTETRMDAYGHLVKGDLDGIDNDGNGYVDDVIGYDFVDQSSINFGDAKDRDPIPVDENDHSHGTAVAGVIAAKANNAIGVAGIAPKCRLVALRAFDATGNAEDDDIASAIVYAAENNVRILNLSFGDYIPSLLQRDAIRYAVSKGVIIFASSGNDGSTLPHYPSDFDECISVGGSVLASDNVSESEVSTSTHGSGMDIIAPSEHIMTLSGANGYKFIQGTSFSSPAAAAVAGLMLAHDPSLTGTEIRSILESTAKNLDPLGYGPYEGNGRIDALAALKYIGSSAIKIESPNQNRAFHVGAKVVVIGSSISALFKSFEVTVTKSDTRLQNPTITKLITSDSQKLNDTLAVWDTKNFANGSYVITLSVNTSGEHTIVENITIHLFSSAPQFTSSAVIPIYVNEKRGLLIDATTDTLTSTTLYFKPQGVSDWKTKKDDRITKEHNILLTNEDAPISTPLELELIAYTQSGDSATINLSGIITPETVNEQGFVEKNYALPTGYVLDTVLPTSNGDQVVENVFPDGTNFGPLNIFTFDKKNRRFTLVDSLTTPWIPRSIGNTTGDNKPELLLQSGHSYLLYKQNTSHSLLGDIINSNAAGSRSLAVGLTDIDGDGKQELVVEDTIASNELAFKIYKLSGTSATQIATLRDTSPPAPHYLQNNFNEPDARFADINGDGKPEIITADGDADILAFQYDQSTPNHSTTIFQDVNDGETEGRLVTSGDFNADGKTDIALAYHTPYDPNSDNEYAASYWTVKVMLGNGDATFKTVYVDHFYLARSLLPYRASIAAIKNVTGNSGDNLILSLFPNFYLLQFDASSKTMKPVWHYPLSNSPRGAIAFDFDGNGKREFGFNTGDSLHFFEYTDAFVDQTTAPSGLEVVPRDTNRVDITWGKINGATEYYILRAAATKGAFYIPLDSTKNPNYSDTTVFNDSNYIYAVQAYDESNNIALSNPSFGEFAHVHPKPHLLSAQSLDSKVTLRTSEPMSTEVLDGGAFVIDDSIFLTSAIVASDSAIILTAQLPLFPLSTHHVSVSSFAVRDKWNSPFDDSEKISWKSDAILTAEEFYITRWKFEGTTTIFVEFNLLPDDNALDPSHYTLFPFGKIGYVERVVGNPNAVTLTLTSGTIISALGTPFVLCVKDITAEQHILLEATTGNCAGETLTEPDLDHIMVYPNPVTTSDNTMTFARLTAEAEIAIYTLDNRFINRIKTSDRTGGVTWDLNDDSGRAVPSGVYWYHVTGKDDHGNSVKPNESKFVIIKNK
ncbi:MAG: S8 family serine peptidase [bacterium]